MATKSAPTGLYIGTDIPLASNKGGTGVSNSSTITLAGALVTTGAFTLNLTTTASSTPTFPTGTTTLVPTTGTGATGTWNISITGTSSGAPPTGTAGGDLTGTYPNPTVGTNKIVNSYIRQSSSFSVIGNSTNSTANVADITATLNGTVLRLSGTTLGFGALDLSLGGSSVTNALGVGNGGTALNSVTTGAMLYGASASAYATLAGNFSTTKQYLSQVGNGTTPNAPAWSSIAGTEVTGAALTAANDTNVTLTLAGTPATSLLRAASLTMGWTGTLANSRGGTGTGTSFTAGSVIFAGTSGIYSQNNAELFWDNTNFRLMIGSATTFANGFIEVRGGVAGAISVAQTLLSPRSFGPAANDGVQILAVPQNGTLGSHDYGLIFMGNNPNTNNGGAGLFQLRVGGSSSSGSSNGTFLQALTTGSGTISSFQLLTGSSVVALSINSSQQINIPTLSVSSLVFTDASSNLTSTGTVSISHGGTNAVSQTTNGVIYYNGTSLTSSSSMTYNSTLFSVSNSISAGQGFECWSSSQLTFYSDSGITGKGFVGPGTVISDISIASTGSGNFLRLGANAALIGFWMDNNIEVNNSPNISFLTGGFVSLNMLGGTVKIARGTNGASGTGAVMTAGAVTVSTTAVATGDIVIISKTASGGTLGTGMPTVTISNGVSFTLTSTSALETSTFSWFIVKAA